VIDPVFVEGDAFLHLSHFRRQVRLIPTAEGMRRAALKTSEPACVKRKMLSMNKQHIQALIAKILSDCQTGKGNAQTRSGRLCHLTVNECHLRLLQGFHIHLGHVELAGGRGSAY